MQPARNAREAARNRETLRQELSKILKRNLTEEEALDIARRGVKVLEQVERGKRKE